MSVTKGQLLAAALNQLVHHPYEILSKDDAIGIKKVQVEATYEFIRRSMLIYSYPHIENPHINSMLTVSNPHIEDPYIRKPQRVLNKDTKICIVGVGERTRTMMVDLNESVQDLRWDIVQEYPELIHPSYFRLLFAGKPLHVESDEQPLTHFNIVRHSTLAVVLRVTGGGGGPLFLFISDELLEPAFDDDFTHVSDDGRVFKRGGYPYRRPYGWNRIALKVKGKYENDIWLGAPHHRTESSPGEWPVSYHGTKKIASMKIAEEGYDGDKCSADAKFGKGHYSTPNIDHAATHSDPFEVDGKKYKVVIQNRVNVRNSKIIPKDVTGYGADYYMTHSSNDIRPYAVCIKEATF